MNLSSNFMSCINITFNKLSFSLYFTFKTLSSNKSNYKKYLNGSFIVWYLLFCLINAYNIPIKTLCNSGLVFGMKYSWEGQSRCQNRCNLWVTRWSWMLDPIKQSFKYCVGLPPTLSWIYFQIIYSIIQIINVYDFHFWCCNHICVRYFTRNINEPPSSNCCYRIKITQIIWII